MLQEHPARTTPRTRCYNLGRDHAEVELPHYGGGGSPLQTEPERLADGESWVVPASGRFTSKARGPGLLSAVEEQRPDVAVVDVRMPPGFKDEGLKAALETRRRTPGLAVLVLSQYVEERYGRELLESGAEGTGYLLKDRVADVGEFVAALESVAAGGTVLDPEVGRPAPRPRAARRRPRLPHPA